jgi:hypothetical protein
MSEDKDVKNPSASDPGVSGKIHDENLRSLLRAWHAPEAPSSLDARILVAFRKRSAPGLWSRIFTAKIEIPAPVAVAFGILFLISSLLAARALQTSRSNQDPATQSATSGVAGEDRPDLQKAAAAGIPAIEPATQITSQAYQPSTSAGISGESAIISKPIPVRPGAATPDTRVSIIFLQSDQGTIQWVTGGNYRLNAIPKIYAGNYFKPSDERQKP